jgi:hypothetical protein
LGHPAQLLHATTLRQIIAESDRSG